MSEKALWNRLVVYVGSVLIALAFSSIVVGIVWTLAASHAEYDVDAKHYAETYSADEAYKLYQKCNSPDPRIQAECIAAAVETTRDHQRNEENLKAQRETANWAYAMTWIAFFSLLATFGGIFFVRENLLEMQKGRAVTERAVRVSERAINIAERPWLSVSVKIASPLVFRDEEGTIAFDFIVINHGKTPATAVEVRPHLTVGRDSYFNRLKQTVALAKQRRPITTIAFGHKAFPGQPLHFQIQMTLRRDEIEAYFTANPSTYSIIYVTATLSGCVVYDSVLGDRNHVTEFILGLAQRDSSGGRMWLPFPVEDGEISADRLVLEPGMGSGNAD